MSISVSFKNVTKRYKMYKKTSDKLLDLALPSGYGKDFYALQNISFVAEKGDIIGIIGVNGAGKSTLSNLISGVIPPSSGTIKVKGDAALISIGAGLNNQLTGRENIELKCLMLGFKKDEIETLMPEIIDFAEIGDFIDQPVKKYSSGMKSRLGFAISVNIDPDILVIDEALSVGDKIFAQKCLEKMNSFKEKGKTIFFISHSISQIKEFCEKALWMEAGQIREYGLIDEVVPKYEQFIKDFNKMSKEEKKQFNLKVMETRSKLQHTPVNQSAATSRSDNSKKKSKRLGLNIFRSLLVLMLIVASTFLILKWDNMLSFFQADSKEPVSEVKDTAKQKTNNKDKKPVKEAAKAPVQDIRYVKELTGFVRDLPNLSSSQKITMMYFGDKIIVEEIEKDPVEDFNWLKFSISPGKYGWISENLLTQVKTNVVDKNFIKSIEDVADLDDFSDTLALFGKSQLEVNRLKKMSNGVEVEYDETGFVSELSTDLANFTQEELVAIVGEPTLQQEDQAVLYHGETYDFILYKPNGVSFSTMTIKKAVSEEKASF